MDPSKQTLPARNLKFLPKTSMVPSPSFRHAAPSAPWPWVDIDDEINPDQKKLMGAGKPPIPAKCDHQLCDNCWKGYPGAQFPNWTPSQVRKSRIAEVTDRNPLKTCVCHRVDIDDQGHFKGAEAVNAKPGSEDETWKGVLEATRPASSKTRAIFVENMSGPILQMLGTKYNIEPFFFSSSLNWIPSRFQTDLQPGNGDHITITLVFLRSVSSAKMSGFRAPTTRDPVLGSVKPKGQTVSQQPIDTKAPLKLIYPDRFLCLDLLSVHLIRNINQNTIISYHPDLDLPTTGAADLRERIRFAGQSVYWQKMLQESHDPTLVLLIYLWHALYSWDQALEHLYSHIRHLESNINLEITEDLHVIRAHQLFYASLLDDFRERVEFIRKHENPAITSGGRKKKLSKHFLERECDNLNLEITRLNRDLVMQEKRLKNMINLVFSNVNIDDNTQLKDMTEAAVRDSAAMKQIAYLSMVFLPATFMTGIFGMNTKEINPGTKGTLPHYVAFAAPLTMVTIWIIIAFQSRYLLTEQPFLVRLGWPYFLLKQWWSGERYAPVTEPKYRSLICLVLYVGIAGVMRLTLRYALLDYILNKNALMATGAVSIIFAAQGSTLYG